MGELGGITDIELLAIIEEEFSKRAHLVDNSRTLMEIILIYKDKCFHLNRIFE